MRPDRIMVTKTAFFVLTPAGEAGPYFSRQAAEDAARAQKWVIVSRKVQVEQAR